MEILDQVVQEHAQRTTDELVDWCHKKCAEYEIVEGRRRKPITVERILQAGMKSEDAIQKVIESANELEEMDKLLA
jgi:hypothetical protein